MARIKHDYELLNKEDLKSPHIFVVDMINGFCVEGAMADSNIQTIIPNIEKLLTNIDQVLSPIFFVDYHKADAIEFKSFPPHCEENTSECEIVEDLKKYVEKQDDIILKNSTNGFHELSDYCNNLLSNKNKIKEIIVTGCCTDICVMQFALSLKTWLNKSDLDIDVIIPVDCVDTYDSGNDYHPVEKFNELALTLMSQAGIKIVSSIE